MKNFLFGRGAKCGMCNRLGSPLGLVPPAMPYAPAAAAECGCPNHGAGEVCADNTCGGYGAAYSPENDYLGGGYAPATNDPYMGGTAMGGDVIGSSIAPYSGQVYGQGSAGPGNIVSEGYVPNSSMNDNFNLRAGERLQYADPLPSNAQPLPYGN